MTRLYKCFVEDYDLTLEESEERKRVRNFLDDKVGKGYFDKYLKVRDRLNDSSYKDFNKLIKQDPEEVKIVIDRANGDEPQMVSHDGLIGENEDFKVYRVTDFPIAKELGINTRWCITGRYGSMNRDDDSYFTSYLKTNNLDGGYYFYISKNDPYEKYCVLLKRNGSVDSIWKSPNGKISSDTLSKLNFPHIKGLDLSGYDYPNDDPDGDPPFTEDEEKYGYSIEAIYDDIDNDRDGDLSRRLDNVSIDTIVEEGIDFGELFDRAIEHESYNCASEIAQRDYDSSMNAIDIDKYISSKKWKAVDILLEDNYDFEDISDNSFTDILKDCTEQEFKDFVLFSKDSDNINLNELSISYPLDNGNSNLLDLYLYKVYNEGSWELDDTIFDILLDAIDLSKCYYTLYNAVYEEGVEDYNIIKKLVQNGAPIDEEDSALDVIIEKYYDYDENSTQDEGGSKRHELKKIIKYLYKLGAKFDNYEVEDIKDILGSSINDEDYEEEVQDIINTITNMQKKKRGKDTLEKYIKTLNKTYYNEARIKLLTQLSDPYYIYTLLQGLESSTIERPILLSLAIMDYHIVQMIASYLLKNNLSDKILLPLHIVQKVMADYKLNKAIPEMRELFLKNLSYYGKIFSEIELDYDFLNSVYVAISPSVMEEKNYKYLETLKNLNKEYARLLMHFFIHNAIINEDTHKAKELIDEAKSLGILDLYDNTHFKSIFTELFNLCYNAISNDGVGNKDFDNLYIYALKSDMNRSEIEKEINRERDYYEKNKDSSSESSKFIAEKSKYMANLLSSTINLPLI